MKHTLKQALALFIAVLLATLGPVGALSEGIDLEQVVSENIEPPVEEAGPFELGDLQLDDGGVSLQEGLTLSYDEAPEVQIEDELPEDIGGEAVLELGDTEAETPVVEETEPTEPFDQAVTIDGAVIAVTAEAGVFPAGAALRVEAVNSETVAQAVEAAVGVEGVYVHRQYRVEIVDSANNVILPDYEQGVPAVRVEGLDLPAGSRVAVYDYTVPGAYEIDARVNEGAIAFALVDAGVYDIFTIEPPTEAQEEAPVEGETEEPTEQSAEGDAEEPAEGETEEPAEQPGEGETEDPAQQATEGETEEPAEGEAEEESTDEVIEEPVEVEGEAIQPVSVVFDAMPETAVVTVWPAANGSLSEEAGSPEGETEGVVTPEAIPAQEDGSFVLLPGEYTYTAEAEGYVSLENVPFTVTGDEQPLLLSFALEAQPEETPEPVAFDQSQTVNGVIVTVRAEPGVFPEGAALSVKRVPVYKQRQADAAVEEVRDENQNVAVSYTFDIKVIDPATREEFQPAEGQTVSVSFALAEVADENLETSVYHIDDSGAAEKLDVTQEDEVTASVETEGFSLYTVEFTYNTLEYVLPGDSSVAMSEILTTLGLAGEVTAVEISDTSLFSASNETGEWIVTAHQAFDTTEWMKVTINGVVYEIRVTDDGSGLAAIGYLYYADEAAAIAGNTTTGSCTDYTVVSDQTAWGEAGQTKWYVVNSSVTIADRITASGDVHLILSDGCTLTASKGIGVTDGNSLTIYGQSADESTMGVLKSQNALSNNAAIGGESSISSGQITINGGKITVKGGNNAAGIGGGRSGKGSVTVNGGVVTVNANSGSEGSAGIGGGYRGSGVVTINGGTVSANGREGGAGIGGGGYGAATVTVNGGSVTARGGGFGVGIGSGSGSQIDRSYTAAVTINGGTVDAYTGSGSGYKGAAIGCGAHTHGTVTITGGNVTATTYNSGACIGGIVNDTGTNSLVTITGGNVTAKAASNNLISYAGIGGSNCDVILGWTNETDSITSPKWGGNGSSTVSFAEGKSFQYEDTHSLADAASLRDGATLIPFVPAAQKNVDQADVSGVRAWYPYTGSAIEPEPVVTYAGTALTKETDYTLSYTSDHTSIGEKAVTITGKGNYTGTKTIYYQIVEASTTYLDDTGTSQTCATFQCLDQSDTALSAGWYLVYDDLTINDRVSLSGDVNLILKDGKTLTSMKGISVPGTASLTVYAQSSSESTAGKLLITDPEMFFSGIGNDYKLSDRDSHGNITIVGGVIEAKGGISGAAIGSALSASQGGNIVIKGGFVTANGTGGGAGIGSGANTDGGMVTINGGKVTATSIGGAAIGSGGFGDGKGSFGTINITGGTVSAKSESGGAGIGGGSNSAGGTISITGGTVTASASGDTGGAGIGGGKNAAGGSITVQNATIARAAANAGAGIGSGGGESAGTTTVIIGTGATVTNAFSEDGAGIGSGKNSSAACSVTIRDGADVTAKSTIGAGIGGGAGASNFSVTIQDKNTTVNAWAGGIGIQDGNGNLSAYGGAAIGGGANVNGGTVNIEGGTVTAKAIGGGAGIGSGTNTKRDATETNSGTITISGGTVTAAATHRAAGIGGGRRSNGGTITINGGTIVANGSDAAGIGHGGKDTLWEGQGSFHIPIIDDPTQDVGGAWYDSIVPIDGTNKATTDGNVTFSYAGGGTVSITASSYPSAPTLSKDFMYSDNGVKVVATSITGEKTIIPYSAHLHSFTYSASGATITATCSAANCPLASSQATLTINAPAELIYDGTAKAVTIIGEIPGVTTPDIVYKQDETILAAAPVNAGTYIASITLGEGEGAKTASVTYTIAQKPATVTAKAQSVAMGGSIATGIDQAELAGALTGHALTAVTLTASSTESTTTEGTIIPSAASIQDGETDVTANYDIRYESGVLTVVPAVTFDSNGGSAVDTQMVNPGSKAMQPTDPTNGNARFMGWYQVTDGQTANTAFDFETAVNESIDLKAKWGYEITPQYNVLGSIGFISGVVESDGYYGIVGEDVVLALTPNEGCLLTGLTNNDVDVMGSVVNGRYTFTMPSGNVTVSATFKQLYTVSVSKNALITQTFTVNSQAVTPIDADEYNMTLQIPAGAVVSITAAPVDSSEYRIEDIDIRREDTHDHFGTVTDGENGARTATFTMVEAEVYVHVNVQETGWHVYTGVPVYDGEDVIFKVAATPHHGEAGTPITLTVEKADDVTLDSMDYVYNDKAAGEEITVSLPLVASGNYTFTMPDSEVFVEPKYHLTRKHQIINQLGVGPSVCLVFKQDEYITHSVETTTANTGDTVRVYPNGATLQGFKVNGTEVAPSGDAWDPYYEFTMPDGNATLAGSVTYSLQTYGFAHGTVTVKVGDEVTDLSTVQSLSIPAGAQVTVTATPDAGYKLYRLSYSMDGQYGRGSDEKGGVEIQSGVPFTMPRGNIVIDAEFSTPWNKLRNQIDNARDGDTITLTEDATAPAGEGCLGISYKSITVDLNGHTINRNLTAPTDYGCVISVDSSAALTLVDSVGGGKITGGNNNYNGGGIAVAGTLNLQGGKITGNSASDGGGVAVISSGAVFTLTGGEISDNANTSSRSSAGVLYTSGAMNVSGSPVVTDAVYVDLNRKLHVTGPLTNATPIPVIIAGGVSVPFTDGLPNNGNAANFKSADDDYRVRVNADGEAELKTVYSVTVAEDIANGTVTADLTTAIEDDAVTLTATPAEGYAFSHFTVTDASGESVSVSPEGRIIMPDSNVTVTATFITEWKWLQNRMAEGWTITLEKDITCADQSEGPLVVPKDVTSTLDLNGHTVNRGLAGKDAVEGGNVISVRGTLTVNDSSTDKTGKITGGNNSAAGGGVMLDGTFTLNGGAVTGNRTGTYAGGILNYGTFNMTGGAISDNSAQNAGGVYNGGTFNLSGGLICGNTASDSFGGGVYNNLGSVFNMSGSASIVGNHAATGGGVFNGGAFTLSESASITDNTANNGGGVANMGTFNMTGSAAITGNAATEAGGGLYHAGSAITLSGDIALSGNTGGDIHLLEIDAENKPALNISGALTNADPIGVSYEVLEGTLPDTIPFTQGLNGNGSAANFKSASDDYRVRVNADGEAELYGFYTVTFAQGEHGALSADKTKVSVSATGDARTVTLTVTPDTGYVLTDLAVTYTDGEGTAQTITPVQDGTDATKHTFAMPEANVQVSATFRQILQIFIQWSGNSHSSIEMISGFVGDDGNYSAIVGDTVTFRVTPESGYGVSSVSATEDYGENDVTVTDLGEGMYSFVMPGYNVNLYAECTGVHVNIPTGHGTVTVEPEHPKADNTVTLTVSPDSGYALGTLAVTKDGTEPAETVEITAAETEGEYTFTMPAVNVTVTATFKKLPVVTFVSNGGSAVESQTIAEGGKAKKPVDPTKEGYRFLGWYADGATEAFDFNTAITADITLTAHWQKVYTVNINADAGCIVTVTADYSEEDGGTPVASGDIVDAGTVLTVTARARAGYRLTATPEASYTVNDDLTITAASEALTYTLTLTHENGAAPTFTGTDNLTAVPYGAKVTVNAGVANEGYEFIGWYQTNGKRLTSNKSYAVSMYSDATYEARYQAISGVVTFMANGNVQKTVTTSSIVADDFPADPTPYYGFVFAGWDKTVEDINAALSEGSNVTVTAQFETIKQSITVTIYNGDSETPTTETITESMFINVTAEDVNGKSFAYWTQDDGTRSYKKTSAFWVTQNTILRAIYTTEAVEAVGTATIKTAAYNVDTKKLVINAYLTVPDGAIIVKSGLIAASPTISAKYTPGDVLTENNADYVKSLATAEGKSGNVSYTWTKSTVQPGAVWYARAYLRYTVSGTENVVYGDLLTISAGEDYDNSEKGTAAIVSRSYNGDTKKVSFNAYLSTPENAVIVKAGLVAASGVSFDPTTTVLTAANADFVKSLAAAEGKSGNVSYTWTKTKVNAGDIWYVRAYLVYTLDGVEHTVYGALVPYTAQ